MNHSAYLFGKFGFGYTQYPDDYAKDILKSVATNNKVKTQVDTESDSTKGLVVSIVKKDYTRENCLIRCAEVVVVRN